MVKSHKSPNMLVRIGIQSVTLVAIFLSTLLIGRVATAAVVVNISEQEVSCTSISVVYSVSGSASGAVASIIAWNSVGTNVGFASASGAPGTWTATVPTGAQPAGTVMYVTVSIGSASAQSAPTPCSGGGSGGPGSNPPPWSGYGDGRLNPNPAEYYSVWCKYNQIEVWRAVPQTILVGKISLAAVVALGNQGSLNAGNGLTVARNNDSVTVSGSNGNKAPASGSKSFNLSDCIAHNGGAPPSPASASRSANVSAISPTPSECSEFVGTLSAFYRDLLSIFPNISCNQAKYLVVVFSTCWGTPGLVIMPTVFIWFARPRRKTSSSKRAMKDDELSSDATHNSAP